MSPSTLEELLSPVAHLEFALIHEASLAIWGLDNNLIPYAVDLLVSESAFASLLNTHGWHSEIYCGNRYIEQDSKGVPLRAWLSTGDGMMLKSSSTIGSQKYSVRSLDPELVLRALPSSPEADLLHEQRAGLAEVLYADQMSDEELAEFRRYVRTV